MTKPDELEEVRARVRARYAQAAAVVTEGGIATCADSCGGEDEIETGPELYSGAEQDTAMNTWRPCMSSASAGTSIGA